MTSPNIKQEITVELLSDLGKALSDITKQAFPHLPMLVQLRTTPYLHLVIIPQDANNPIYGHIINAKAEVTVPRDWSKT